jgi:glycosyltransferase involved in cell wall biosynthesis
MTTTLIPSQPVADRPLEAGPQLRNVLLVSYHFPPVGGAGVQRPVKFVKYLREFGWDPTVLVAENPSVPVFDPSLVKDLPEALRLIRARTLEPAYAAKQSLAGQPGRSTWSPLRWVRQMVRGAASLALQPDPQVLWLPAAYRAARRALAATPHSAILATAPSYSNLLLGAWLKRQTGLPLVLDYRDEWDLSSHYLEHSRRDIWSQTVQQRMQRWILRQADAIVATTRRSTAHLLERARQAGSHAFGACVYNGFDPCDFEPSLEINATIPRSERFRIVYTGTLWNLTSIAPVVTALEQLLAERPDLAEQIELVAVGRKTPEQAALLARLNGTAVRLVTVDYCDHETAIAWMQSADALLLLLTDGPGADRVAPAKLFEYLAVGRPILGVVPNGETAEIVSRFWPSGHQPPENPEAIARWVAGAVAAKGSAAESVRPLGEEERQTADAFSRRRLTQELAGILDRVSRSGSREVDGGQP